MLKVTVFIWCTFLVSNIFAIVFKDCPKSEIQEDLDVKKLMGVWYLYSISSSSRYDIRRYKPDCETADIKRRFEISKIAKDILATDYSSYILLAKCKPLLGKNNVIASILTREKNPSEETIIFASNLLEHIQFPMESLKKVIGQELCLTYVNRA